MNHICSGLMESTGVAMSEVISFRVLPRGFKRSGALHLLHCALRLNY